MTSGIKFGVDFLAYRADPSTCHAAFMVAIFGQCDDDGSSPASRARLVSPMDLVARSRVATTALKICVLAYVNDNNGSVSYEAFKRMGVGHAVFAAGSAAATTIGVADAVSLAPLAGRSDPVTP